MSENKMSAALLEPEVDASPQQDWQCRTPECSKPVFGTARLCSACMILFGPYEILMANPQVTEWDLGDGAAEDAGGDPART